MCSLFSDANSLLSGESNCQYNNSQQQPACSRLDLLHMKMRVVGINGILYFTKQLLSYMAFHNILHDYKHLQEENQRIYFNGIVHRHRKTEKVLF